MAMMEGSVASSPRALAGSWKACWEDGAIDQNAVYGFSPACYWPFRTLWKLNCTLSPCQTHLWMPWPPWDSIWKWGLWEVTRLRYGAEGRDWSVMGLVTLYLISLHHVGTWQEGGSCGKPTRGSSPRIQPWHPDLGLLAFPTVKNRCQKYYY